MKKLRHIATRLLICVLVLSQTYIPKNAYANVITEQNLQTEETVNIKEKKSIIIEDKYEVIFSIEDQWNEKFQGNITIKNTSDHALKNWSLNFIMNHEIDNIWNAEITSHNNDTYILKNNNSNEIAPGACISIGYQATYTDIIQLPSQCKLTYVTQEVELQKEYIFHNDGYDVIFKATSQWNSAFNGEIEIINTGEKVLENWAMEFNFNHEITNIWNAAIEEQIDDTYIIKNAVFNQDILPNNKVNFGFQASCNDCITLPSSFTIMNSEEKVENDFYTIEYKKISDWGSGFNGQIAITNHTDTTIEDWFLEFDFEHQINSFWTAVIEKHEGTHYVIRNAGYNANILPHETLILGFGANSSDVNSDPSNYKLQQIVIKEKTLTCFSEYGINFLKWDFGEENCYYKVVRKNSNNELIELKTLFNTNYYVDLDVNAGETYEYQVIKLKSELSEEQSSNIVSVIASPKIDTPPENPEERVYSMLMLDNDYENLEIIYSDDDWEESVTQNLILSTIGELQSTITWKSLNPSLLTNEGYVTRILDEDSKVTLLATLQNGDYVKTKEFQVNIIRADQKITEIKDMTWEDIKQINGGELPELRFYDNGDLERIKGQYTDLLVFTENDAKNSIYSVKDLFGIKDVNSEFTLNRSTSNTDENIFYFNQCFHGVPILGANITVIANKNGITNCINANYMKDLAINTVPSITETLLPGIAKDKLGSDAITKARLVLFREDDSSETVTLCWEIELDHLNCRVYVDANTGVIIYKEPLTYSAKGSGNDIFNNPQEFPVKKTGILWWTNYYLEDTTRKLSICDGRGTKSYEPMESSSNVWTDSTAITAYCHAIQTYDFFKALGWIGYNGKNGAMNIVVHFQEQDSSGNWNDVSNAYGGGSDLKFGDGNGSTTRSFASDIDTVAHEFTHSVTWAKLPDLRYSNHAGAINEGYSDIFGELVDYKKDWLHGVDNRIGKDVGTPSRDLINPLNTSDPKELYKSNYEVICADDNHDTHTSCSDNGYVHQNSTIIGHVAYLMHNKGLTDGELASLWLRSYDYYYNKTNPNFYDCRDAVLEAADKLGFSNDKKQFIIDAFNEVNISRNDITITVLDAINNTVISNQNVKFASTNKLLCSLSGACCSSHGCLYVSCDPDSCNHMCDSSCSRPCTILANKCCKGCIIRGANTSQDGIVTFNDVIKGYHRIKITRAQYEDFNELIYVDDNNKNFTIMLESPYENSVSGKITIADKDTNINNNVPLSYARITLTKKTGSIELIKTTNTDTNGMYSIADVPAGEYELKVERTGYITIIQTIFIERGQNQFYNMVLEAISDEYKGLGFAGGKVIDAFTGNGVPGLTLSIYEGIHIIPGVGKPSGKFVGSIVSDEQGNYHTSALNAGNYTIVVTDLREGINTSDKYYQSMFVIKILGNTDILSQDGTVSKSLERNQVRIVLTWGSTPRDLDSHLSIVTNEGTTGHVYYANKSFYVDSKECANLDLDDTTSYGPETTTIFTEIDGTFTFRVHDYTNRYNSSNSALANSGATVSVYTGYSTMPIRIYYVPTGIGTNWDVFSYDSNIGSITTINTLY